MTEEEAFNPYSLQRKPWQEFRFLRRGDKFINLSRLTNPQDRVQAAQEMRSVLLEAFSGIETISLIVHTDEEIKSNEHLAEKMFGSVRPTGKLLGLFHLEDRLREGIHFTVSVFETNGELIVHRDGSRDWQMNEDASQATAIAIASAIILNPSAQISVTDRTVETAKYEQLLMLTCLGFKPDEKTIPSGPFTIYPRYFLEGIK